MWKDILIPVPAWLLTSCVAFKRHWTNFETSAGWPVKWGGHLICLKAGGWTMCFLEVPSNCKKVYDSRKYIFFQRTERGKRNNLVADTKEARWGLGDIRKSQQPEETTKTRTSKEEPKEERKGWPGMTRHHFLSFQEDRRKNKEEQKAAILKISKALRSLLTSFPDSILVLTH